MSDRTLFTLRSKQFISTNRHNQRLKVVLTKSVPSGVVTKLKVEQETPKCTFMCIFEKKMYTFRRTALYGIFLFLNGKRIQFRPPKSMSISYDVVHFYFFFVLLKKKLYFG